MAQRKALRPGDRVDVPFGDRVVPGVVTQVSGDRIHVALTIDGADEPVASLYRNDQLAPA
jgi:primosomal protein N'